MDRHPFCGKMDTQKQLNVPLHAKTAASSSSRKLAALLKSPSLEGLDSWETIHPDLLPEFTPRFTVTADPSLEPQLEGDARAME